MCCNLRCSKLQGAVFPSPSPPPPSPGDPSPLQKPATLRAGRRRTSSPSRASKCDGGGSRGANSPSGASPSPGLEGTGCWDRPPARQLRLILAISCPASPPPGPSPRLGCRGPPVPAAITVSPSLCSPESESMLRAAGRASTAARPSAGRSGPASRGALSAGSRAAASPGGTGWAASGGRGQGAAPRKRAPPAPRSRRPPAGACARGERRAEGGGAPRERGEEAGEARAGRSGSVRRPAGSRLGLSSPGAAPLLLPAGELDLGSAAR